MTQTAGTAFQLTISNYTLAPLSAIEGAGGTGSQGQTEESAATRLTPTRFASGDCKHFESWLA
jgi:hypothetical protein